MANASDSGEKELGKTGSSDVGEQKKKSGKAKQGDAATTFYAKELDLKANWTQYL